MDEIKIKHANSMYQKLCESMDLLDWKYTKNEDDLVIECSARGDDLPIDLIIKLNVELQILSLFSHLPFTVPEEKRLDFAVVTSIVNNTMVDGAFDYDISDGNIFFRMTNSYCDSTIGTDVLEYLIYCSCHTIDDYNEKLLLLSNGTLTL